MNHTKIIEIEVGDISYQLFQLGCVNAIHRAYSCTSKLKNTSISTEYRIDLHSQYDIIVYEAPQSYNTSKWYEGKRISETANFKIIEASEIWIKYASGKIIVRCSYWSKNQSDKENELRLDLMISVFSDEIRESFIGRERENTINVLKAFPYAFNPITISDTESCTNIQIDGNLYQRVIGGIRFTEENKAEHINSTYSRQILRIMHNETNNTAEIESIWHSGETSYFTCNLDHIICESLSGTNIHINKPLLLSDKNNPTNKIWCYISPSGIIFDNNLIKSRLRIRKVGDAVVVYYCTQQRVISILNSSDGISICDIRLTFNHERLKNIAAILPICNTQHLDEEEALDEIQREKLNVINSHLSEVSKHIKQEIRTEYTIDKISNLNELNNDSASQFLKNNISEINKLEYYDGTVFKPINDKNRDNNGNWYTIRNYVLDVKEMFKQEAWAKEHPIQAILGGIINIFINIIGGIFGIFRLFIEEMRKS